MKSSKRGRSTSELEVTNISQHGFWLWLDGTEYFLPFEQYPWFKNAVVSDILNVKLIHGRHLRWPRLDVDLSLDILREPGRYPLTAKSI